MFLFQKHIVDGSEEYTASMPMQLDDDMMDTIVGLIESLRANEDVEDVYCSAVLHDTGDE